MLENTHGLKMDNDKKKPEGKWSYLKHVPLVAGMNSSWSSKHSKLTVRNSALETWNRKGKHLNRFGTLRDHVPELGR